MELFVSIFQEVIVVTAQKDIQGIPAKKVNITSGENEDDIYKNESDDWQADWLTDWSALLNCTFPS